MDKYDKIYTALTKELDDIITFSSMCMLEAVQDSEQGQGQGHDNTSKKRLAITATITALKNTITEIEQELSKYENHQP